jgi:lipopolysaccharide/colanic/teichoic acid biosynthesis glycosyltransferase
MPFIVAQYEPWQRRRLDAVPGMTGLWQILGRKDLPLRDNLEYDFYYIRNQSLLLDVAIFLRTLPLVIFGRGAY